jgi:hypothetical protein
VTGCCGHLQWTRVCPWSRCSARRRQGGRHRRRIRIGRAARLSLVVAVFLEAQTAGRLVYRQTGGGRGEQVTLKTWNPEEDTELFMAPRLAGG